MPRLDIVSRNIAIGRLEAGESQYVVAQHYNVHRSTISRLWQRYLQTGTSNDRPRTSRPRITTAQYIAIYVLSIYATGQLQQHRLLQAYLAFAEYPHKQYAIACETLDCEPDDLILVLSWGDNIGVHGSDGATQLGTGL